MKKCLKHTIRHSFCIIIVSASISTVAFMIINYNDSNKALNTKLWLQSAEQQLELQNDKYYNELYERYSRIHRDLNDYQYNTNTRLSSLESRVNALEGRVRDLENTDD